jgi:hypothetical protein
LAKEKERMPAKTKPQDIIDKISWIEKLPDGGASWGQGLTMTAAAVAREIEDLEKTKANIEEQIRKRLRVMRAIPGRAEREAPLMYSDEIIDEARSQVIEYSE